MGNPKEAEAPTSDLVSADAAAESAKESGAGSQAEWDARIADLENLRDRRFTLATIALSAARQSADVWGKESKKGSGILKTAEAAYKIASDEATAMYNDGVAKFASSHPNHASRVPSDLMENAVRFTMARHLAPVLTALQSLDSESVPTIDLGNGTVANVLETVEFLSRLVNGSGVKVAETAEAETVETPETVEA